MMFNVCEILSWVSSSIRYHARMATLPPIEKGCKHRSILSGFRTRVFLGFFRVRFGSLYAFFGGDLGYLKLDFI